MAPPKYLIFYLVFFAALSAAYSQGRLRPPENVGCDRNELTSYTGELREFSQDKSNANLTIRTDEQTTERITVPKEKLGNHTPRKGDRLRAWVCTKGPVTIEWLSPSPPR